jgi:hypothetical protein
MTGRVNRKSVTQPTEADSCAGPGKTRYPGILIGKT